MAIFIDASGKYYQAEIEKDSGDAKIEFPTPQMLEYLTANPVTIPDFGRGVQEAEVKKLVKSPVTKTVAKEVTKEDLKTL